MSDILSKIVDYKSLEVEHQRRHVGLIDLKKRCADVEPARSFYGNFVYGELNIIAEVKKASPSAGLIRDRFNAVEIAKIYQDNGASAISVLTDTKFFSGSMQDLIAVKSAVKLPILRKDFTLNEYQIFEARANGADAILLIVAILDDYQLRDYRDLALELGLGVLVEVHDQTEFSRCMNLNFDVVGVNNRDLKTFKTDVQVTREILHLNQHDCKIISESGLKDHQTLADLSSSGVYGFLIGESLLRQEDIGRALRTIRGGQ